MKVSHSKQTEWRDEEGAELHYELNSAEQLGTRGKKVKKRVQTGGVR